MESFVDFQLNETATYIDQYIVSVNIKLLHLNLLRCILSHCIDLYIDF